MAVTIAVKNPDDKWVKDLLELKEYADHKRLAAWNRWNAAWRVYNNEYDFSSKADWQAKNYVAKIAITVEMAASLVRRAMLDANEYFRYEGSLLAPYLEKIAYWYLDQPVYGPDRLRFVDAWIPPLKGGFIGSLIVLKLHLGPWVLGGLTKEQSERSARGEKVNRTVEEDAKIMISFPDPYNIWLDPTGRNMFVIEEETLDMAAAWDLADMGVLDGDALMKIDEDWTEETKEVHEEKRKQNSLGGQRPSFRRELKLTHFWGSLPGKKRWAIHNGHYVMGNDKYVLRQPDDNPYDHKRSPYVIGSPFRRPFSVYHKGLIEDVVGLANAMTEFLNLTLDSALFSGIKAFEVDLDQIEDPQQILNGIFPGKVFTKRSGNSQQKSMIQDISISGVARETTAIYGLLNQEYQNTTAVTEFISGAASAGMTGKSTATEVVTKQHQGMGIFSEIAQNLEGSVLEPALGILASLISQYHDDFTSPEITEMMGPELAADLAIASYEQRSKLFDIKNLKTRVRGLSSLLSRTEEVQKLMNMMGALGQFGEFLPIMFQDLDMPYFFKGVWMRLVRSFGWNEKDFLRKKSPEQITQEQAAAAANAAPGAGTTPAEPGGPPNASPQPGQGAPPQTAQVMGQIQAIRDRIGAGATAPSRLG